MRLQAEPSLSSVVADRAHERPHVRENLVKPGVLGRATQRWLCLACLATILYGTLGPLGNQSGPWLARPAAWSWILPNAGIDTNDVITNFVVYLPVGVALRLLLRRRGRAGVADFVAAVGLSVVLSYATELLQQYMPQRSANMVDVVVNGIGGIVGALVAVPVQRALRRVHAAVFESVHLGRERWSVLMWAALAVAALFMAMPFTLKRPSWVIRFGEPLAMADPLGSLRFISFAAVGLLVAGRMLFLGAGARTAVLGAIWRVAVFDTIMELAQCVLREHVSSVVHVLVASVGAGAGAVIVAVAVRLARTHTADGAPIRALPRHFQIVAGGAFIAIMLAVVIGEIGVRGIVGGLRPTPEFRWLPFYGHFHVAFTSAMADVAQLGVKFGILTLLALTLTAGRARGAVLLVDFGAAAVIEIARTFLIGRPGDSTTFVVAAIAWLVVTRAWNAMLPHISAPVESPRFASDKT